MWSLRKELGGFLVVGFYPFSERLVHTHRLHGIGIFTQPFPLVHVAILPLM